MAGAGVNPPLKPPKGQVRCPIRPTHIVAFEWINAFYESSQSEHDTLQKSDVYAQYEQYCKDKAEEYLVSADFGRILRSVFPNARDRRIGSRGNSRYCYTGITRKKRPGSPSSVASSLSTEEVDKAHQAVICEWASSVLSPLNFTSTGQLAHYLVAHRFVQTRSAAALTIACQNREKVINEHQKSEERGEVINPHRETQLKLQETVKQRLERRASRGRSSSHSSSPTEARVHHHSADSAFSSACASPNVPGNVAPENTCVANPRVRREHSDNGVSHTIDEHRELSELLNRPFPCDNNVGGSAVHMRARQQPTSAMDWLTQDDPELLNNTNNSAANQTPNQPWEAGHGLDSRRVIQSAPATPLFHPGHSSYHRVPSVALAAEAAARWRQGNSGSVSGGMISQSTPFGETASAYGSARNTPVDHDQSVFTPTHVSYPNKQRQTVQRAHSVSVANSSHYTPYTSPLPEQSGNPVDSMANPSGVNQPNLTAGYAANQGPVYQPPSGSTSYETFNTSTFPSNDYSSVNQNQGNRVLNQSASMATNLPSQTACNSRQLYSVDSSNSRSRRNSLDHSQEVAAICLTSNGTQNPNQNAPLPLTRQLSMQSPHVNNSEVMAHCGIIRGPQSAPIPGRILPQNPAQSYPALRHMLTRNQEANAAQWNYPGSNCNTPLPPAQQQAGMNMDAYSSRSARSTPAPIENYSNPSSIAQPQFSEHDSLSQCHSANSSCRNTPIDALLGPNNSATLPAAMSLNPPRPLNFSNMPMSFNLHVDSTAVEPMVHHENNNCASNQAINPIMAAEADVNAADNSAFLAGSEMSAFMRVGGPAQVEQSVEGAGSQSAYLAGISEERCIPMPCVNQTNNTNSALRNSNGTDREDFNSNGTDGEDFTDDLTELLGIMDKNSKENHADDSAMQMSTVGKPQYLSTNTSMESMSSNQIGHSSSVDQACHQRDGQLIYKRNELKRKHPEGPSLEGSRMNVEAKSTASINGGQERFSDGNKPADSLRQVAPKRIVQSMVSPSGNPPSTPTGNFRPVMMPSSAETSRSSSCWSPVESPVPSAQLGHSASSSGDITPQTPVHHSGSQDIVSAQVWSRHPPTPGVYNAYHPAYNTACTTTVSSQCPPAQSHQSSVRSGVMSPPLPPPIHPPKRRRQCSGDTNQHASSASQTAPPASVQVPLAYPGPVAAPFSSIGFPAPATATVQGGTTKVLGIVGKKANPGSGDLSQGDFTARRNLTNALQQNSGDKRGELNQ